MSASGILAEARSDFVKDKHRADLAGQLPHFVEEAGPEDTVIDAGPVRVAIDRASAPLLDGTVIDLPKPESFRFQNPRARKVCSCGASFEV